MKRVLLAVAASLIASQAHAVAITLDVDAAANSSSGGTGEFAFNVTLGDSLTVSVSPTDLWNAGPLPRWSNADGLTTDLFATGTDNSGALAGTQIGQPFVSYTQANLTAPFGTLVGEIGGVFAVLGTNFSGPAWGTGALNLYYWDSNGSDNSEFITARLEILSAATPEPATMMLLGAGLAGLGLTRRRSR